VAPPYSIRRNSHLTPVASGGGLVVVLVKVVVMVHSQLLFIPPLQMFSIITISHNLFHQVVPGMAVDHYPTARTCHFKLFLPPYSNKEELRSKLRVAILETTFSAAG